MRFLYVGRFSLPNKDAASTRVYNIGYVVKKSNNQVDYLCMEGARNNSLEIENSFYYFAFSRNPSKVDMVCEWFLGLRTVKKIKALHAKNHYDAIILYNVTYSIAEKIRMFCKHENIKIIHDVTEWYEVNIRKGFIAALYAVMIEKRIKRTDSKVDGVIAISPYLFDYYQSIGTKVIRVTPVFHYDRIFKEPENDLKTIGYAGNPGTKDELDIIVRAFEKINEKGIQLRIVFIGANIPNNANELEKRGIYFKPRCENSQVIRLIQGFDFTVLFRRNERFAKAGYSTKVAESLYNGVPVLCNEIGGADRDIQNGINGIKISDLSFESVYKGLQQIVLMKPEESLALRKNSRIIGEKLYKAESYVKEINSFFETIIGCNNED